MNAWTYRAYALRKKEQEEAEFFSKSQKIAEKQTAGRARRISSPRAKKNIQVSSATSDDLYPDLIAQADEDLKKVDHIHVGNNISNKNVGENNK